jgi:NitT/TauT family transport system substrate-binding protein
MKRKGFILLVIGCFSLIVSECRFKSSVEEMKNINTSSNNDTLTNERRKVTFLPYWVASAQFAGYYMAKESGIYDKFGIDLEIVPFQPYITSYDLIKTGKVDFAALWLLNAIGVRTSGIEIVNIAQFSTRSSLMLVTKKSSGIHTLQDMNHKKAGIWSGFELQPRALFSKYNLDVKIIPIGSTNNLFLKDGVDITAANWFDEYHSIINSGYNPEDLNTFFFADYGLNFLEDGIYCLSEKKKLDPKLCVDFVKATMEGWRLAFENPEQAIDIVVAYAKKSNLPVNRVHQRWIIDRYRDLYFQNKQFSTTLSDDDYLFACKILKTSGQISWIPPFQSFYNPYDFPDSK